MGGFNSKSLPEKWNEVRTWSKQEEPWSDFQIEYVKRVHNSKKPHLKPSGEVTNEHAVVRSRILDGSRKALYDRLEKEVARKAHEAR